MRRAVGEVVGQPHRRGAPAAPRARCASKRSACLRLSTAARARSRSRPSAATSRSSFFCAARRCRLGVRARRVARASSGVVRGDRRRRALRRKAPARGPVRAAPAARARDGGPARSRRARAPSATSCSSALGAVQEQPQRALVPLVREDELGRALARHGAHRAQRQRRSAPCAASMQNGGAASPVPGGLPSTRCMRPARASADSSSQPPRSPMSSVASSGWIDLLHRPRRRACGRSAARRRRAPPARSVN